jgi:hypothetical protein
MIICTFERRWAPLTLLTQPSSACTGFPRFWSSPPFQGFPQFYGDGIGYLLPHRRMASREKIFVWKSPIQECWRLGREFTLAHVRENYLLMRGKGIRLSATPSPQRLDEQYRVIVGAGEVS